MTPQELLAETLQDYCNAELPIERVWYAREAMALLRRTGVRSGEQYTELGRVAEGLQS